MTTEGGTVSSSNFHVTPSIRHAELDSADKRIFEVNAYGVKSDSNNPTLSQKFASMKSTFSGTTMLTTPQVSSLMAVNITQSDRMEAQPKPTGIINNLPVSMAPKTMNPSANAQISPAGVSPKQGGGFRSTFAPE